MSRPDDPSTRTGPATVQSVLALLEETHAELCFLRPITTDHADVVLHVEHATSHMRRALAVLDPPDVAGWAG